MGPCMGPTYPIFELNLALDLCYQCTKFGTNRIQIATSNIHTENLSNREIGGYLYDSYASGTFMIYFSPTS